MDIWLYFSLNFQFKGFSTTALGAGPPYSEIQKISTKWLWGWLGSRPPVHSVVDWAELPLGHTSPLHLWLREQLGPEPASQTCGGNRHAFCPRTWLPPQQTGARSPLYLLGLQDNRGLCPCWREPSLLSTRQEVLHWRKMWGGRKSEKFPVRGWLLRGVPPQRP